MYFLKNELDKGNIAKETEKRTDPHFNDSQWCELLKHPLRNLYLIFNQHNAIFDPYQLLTLKQIPPL